MKRFIHCICLVFLWIVFSNFQCSDDENWRYGEWRINNKTTETLIIDISRTKGDLHSYRIEPDSTRSFMMAKLGMDIVFEDFTYPYNVELAEAVVKSENGDFLKTWTYVQREDVGRQFFAEKYWSYAILNGGMDFIWEFSILPEDLPNQ